MKCPLLKRHKTLLLRLIEGYKKVDELISEERKKRLTKITTEGSLKEYDSLCRLYEMLQKEDLDRLNKQRIIFLLKRRQMFDRLGKSKKDEQTIKGDS